MSSEAYAFDELNEKNGKSRNMKKEHAKKLRGYQQPRIAGKVKVDG